MALTDDKILELAMTENEKRLEVIRAGIADGSVNVSGRTIMGHYSFLNMTKDEWMEEAARFRRWVDGRIK